MRCKHIAYSILLGLGSLLCSCQESSVPDNGRPAAGGAFVVSAPEAYSITTTRSQEEHISKSGNMTARWSEGAWEGSDSSLTKGNVTGDEYAWEDSTKVSLYLTDTDGNLLTQANKTDGLGDIPLNPVRYLSYTTYRPYKSNETSKDEITDEQKVTEASFFWDTKKTGRPATMPDMVNFYGYYPRPYDGDGNSLFYRKTSIIEKEKAHSPFGKEDWYILPYSFYDIQTDENLSFHDVMCSISEEGGTECNNRYGNRSKTKDSNVQLHFRHVFSLIRIEIGKGEVYDKDNRKECVVSDLTLSGSEIYTQGKLNILTGETVPALSGSIKREIPEESKSIKDQPLRTTMIVQPIGKATEESQNGRFSISCKIDGIPFSCSIPDITLEAGKKYDIKLTLTPSGGFVFRIWDGATASFGDGKKKYDKSGEYNEVKLDYDSFATSPESDHKITGVFCNGVPVNHDGSGKYPLVKESDTPVYYDIVATPETWYETNGMRIHFDALWNNKYDFRASGDAWKSRTVWSDLSGHGNDGNLKSFNGTDASGWAEKGLNFDGQDDIVTYPGNINGQEYTMELYIYVPKGYVQKKFARMTAEGGNPNGYPCYYFSGGTNRDIELYAHGLQGGVWGGSSDYFNGVIGGKNIVQLDCVFSFNEKTVKIYCNGTLGWTANWSNCTEALSVPIASLGNRIQDNTRALKATFFSFILYDRALTQEEIQKNYSVNESRYGSIYGEN